MDTDTTFMRAAIKQAQKAYEKSEVPIGCVIVHDGKIIARGYNRRNTDKSTLAHAEITAIRKAAKKLGDWRLEDCTLYVTITECVIGCMNPKAGCAGSVTNLLEMDGFNHKVIVRCGILEEECSNMLKTFFRELRVRDAERKRILRQGAAPMVSHQEEQ